MRIINKLKSVIAWHFRGGRKRAKEFARVRAINQKHCYDFAAENCGWKKIGKSPVYGNKKTDNVFDPYVMHDGHKFVMIVSERKFHGIDRLESTDGLHWENRKILLSNRPNTWQHLVNRATMVYHDSKYHLWYTGQSPEIAAIGYSTSLDGLHFDLADTPCLQAELPQEGASVMNPCVIWNDQKHCFQMWYAAGETYEPDVIFYAESIDGRNWVKHKQPVLEKQETHEWEKYKVGGCHVFINEDGLYEMYYIGYQNLDVARICHASSSDGINWMRDDYNVILSPSPNSFDSNACYKPSYLEHEGKEYLWYNGRNQVEEYIGLAIRDNKKVVIARSFYGITEQSII